MELRNNGFVANHKKVRRLMLLNNIVCKTRKYKKYNSYKGNIGRVAPNLINRDFSATRPNQKWGTDVSEFHIAAGKLYLSPIIDFYNGEVISLAISRSQGYESIIKMLNGAFEKYENLENLVLHSDQGWQYQMEHYQKELRKRNITQSMSRKGNCLDNSKTENFFAIIKNEMFYGREHEFKTLEDLENAILDYVDYYNNKRIKLNLKGLSPIQYRHKSLNNV